MNHPAKTIQRAARFYGNLLKLAVKGPIRQMSYHIWFERDNEWKEVLEISTTQFGEEIKKESFVLEDRPRRQEFLREVTKIEEKEGKDRERIAEVYLRTRKENQ